MTVADSPRVWAPRLAFGSWAFSFGPFAQAPWEFERLCAYAADAGYAGVEINGFRPHPHHEDFATAERLRQLRGAMEAAGVLPSGYAPDFTKVPPAEMPAHTYLAEVDAALRFCEQMGITLLRVDTCSPPATLTEDQYKRRLNALVATWQEAAARCQNSGVTLVWEFEPGFWLNRPSEVRDLAEAVDHPAFRVLFDTCHAYAGAVAGARQGPEPELLVGGVVEYAELLAPYVGHLHLIDGDGSLHNGETSEHLPFGEGNIDFPRVLQALEPTLSELDWWGIDFCFCPTTERDARKAVPFVRGLIEAHDRARVA
jgi:sugar phosphate isomerase/epimerase